MITKEIVKAEIEKVRDDYLGVLYQIIKIFELPPTGSNLARNNGNLNWHDFIAKTYGCFANDPIERGDQGRYEIREEFNDLSA